MSPLRAIRSFAVLTTSVFLGTLAACGGGTDKGANAPPDTATPAPTAGKSVTPTGKSITIEMYSDEKGNYFKPSEIEAHPGDVLHFVLMAGVHNVDFLADSNPGVAGLPAPSAMLQLPSQSVDIPVNFDAGKTYYFQCDPHAALGMRGHVKVEQ